MPLDRDLLTDFLNDRTRFGQYPVVAYKLDGTSLIVWTIQSNLLDRAHEILSRYPGSAFPRCLTAEDFDGLDDLVTFKRFIFGVDLGSSFESSFHDELQTLDDFLRPYGQPLANPSESDSGYQADGYVDKNVVQSFIEWLSRTTRDGLFPVVTYSIEGRRIAVLTTNIKDLSYATRVLEIVTDRGYNLGHYIPRPQIVKLAEENQHVFHRAENEFPGLNRNLSREITRIVQSFGAPYFPHRAIGLVDIVGYSKLSPPEQLAYLYSLKSTLKSAIKRCSRFCKALGVRSAFGFESTGDGYYVWHEDVGAAADTATFVLVTAILTHSESFRSAGAFDLQLRASYTIGGLYQMYDHTRLIRAVANAPSTGVDITGRSFWPRAAIVTGPATIEAERIISEGRGSQFLIADFTRPGVGETVMTTKSLVESVNELFALEGNGEATLTFDPDHPLKLLDKHKIPHYCWNVQGGVPNKVGRDSVANVQHIGIRCDTTPFVSSVDFVENPGIANGSDASVSLYRPNALSNASNASTNGGFDGSMTDSDDDLSDDTSVFSSVWKFFGGS